MKRPGLISFLLFVGFFVSQCSSRSAEHNDTTSLAGCWFSEKFDSGTFHRPQFVFWFNDTTTSSSYFYPRCRYSVNRNRLHVWHYDRKRPRGRRSVHHQFQIGINGDTLKLTPVDLVSKQRMIELFPEKKHPKTITLTRVKPKNNIVPTAISFYSSGCYGSCPSLYFEIDSTLHARYYGKAYVEKKKGHTGVISIGDYESLLELIHTIPLDSLRESYSAPWTDDQTCTIAIRYNGKWKSCSVYGMYDEPLELRLLLARMTWLSLRTKLRPDPSIRQQDFQSFHAYQDYIEVLLRPPADLL